MCDSGIEEENVVSEYLALLGEEELNRLEEIYRWKQHDWIFFKNWQLLSSGMILSCLDILQPE